VTNQAVGSNNQVLTADSAQADGVKWANGSAATLTTTGDLLYASAANTPARLAIGSTDQVLKVSGGIPAWGAALLPSYTLAASGSLSGASVSVTGLSGTDFIVELAGATPSATASFETTYNADTTSGRYYRNDSNASGTALFTRNLGSGTAYYIGFKVNGGNGAATVQTGDYNLGGGLYNQTTAITSIQLKLTTGTWSSGTYKIYQR